VDLKLLLKRGALLAAANWQTVAIQFAAQTTFQALLAVPIVAAAVLVAALVGDDVGTFLQGGIREMFAAIADALRAEPIALAAFVVAFAIVLVGGSIFMFLVKGGTVTVLVAASDDAGAIEHEPLTLELLKRSSRFTLARYMDGCGRLFRRYLVLGLILIVVYAASGGGYLALVALGYRAISDGALFIGWTFVAALAAGALVVWITAVNLVYLLVQIAVAEGDLTLVDAMRAVARFVRSEFRDLGGIFLVVLAIVIAATFASALAWSGVALIAFVPLVGLAVVPLQLAALLLRGVLFEYIGATALGAYVTLYRRHTIRTVETAAHEGIPGSAGPLNAWG
jgi:hypothetical protein